MKRVLLITPYCLTHKEVGGAFTYQFCERLANTCRIDVVLFHYRDELIDAPSNDNIKVVYNKKINKFDKFLFWAQNPLFHPLFTSRYSWRLRCFIKKIIKANNYDYLVFDYSQTFALAKEVKHPHKLLIAHDVIAQRFEREGSKLLSWIKWSEKKLVRDADKFYTFSEKDSRLIKQMYGKDSDVTPVFIKHDILETQPTNCADYHVFFADWGRRDNSESLDWFISNVAPFVKHVPFKVIGGGLSSDLKEKINLFENIEYLGFVDNPYPIIANAKSEICPLHTGAGIKVKCLEALACGTPIIGTDVAFEGIDDTFSDYLHFADTPEEYAKLIVETNYSLEQKRLIKQHFISEYSQNSVINYIITH